MRTLAILLALSFCIAMAPLAVAEDDGPLYIPAGGSCIVITADSMPPVDVHPSSCP